VPWLEPTVGDVLAALADAGRHAAIVVPIGFMSDHMEVLYDLDTVAVPAARARGLSVVRAVTPGVALAPVVAALVAERRAGAPRAYLGSRGPSHDGCPRGCCLAG
jgi:ferrochelatase